MYVQGATLDSSKKSDSFNLTQRSHIFMYKSFRYWCSENNCKLLPYFVHLQRKRGEKLTYASFKIL